tara:strand:- start:8285 stop:8899 length:615 start_codon:yes stop_codon:yes gene_type:complete
MKLGIIDLETGNITSLVAAIHKLNLSFKICKSSFDFENVDKIILPGVGAFKDFMNKIKIKKIDKLIEKKIDKNIPLLGICVGFQVLFQNSNEFGESNGLSYLCGEIKSFKDFSNSTKIPHVGWNECKIINQNKLFDGIPSNSDFYFTHSYLLKSSDSDIILTKTNYDIDFVSSINKNNIYGVQFHPEKSQSNGLKLLKNFCDNC